MRILLANKFYYRRGGDCIYTMNLEQLLMQHGHDVAIYAMNYPANMPSKWEKYWPSNMSNINAIIRAYGSKQVRDGFNQLLNDFKPDVVHLNNIHTQLSPIIAEISHNKGIKVVWTTHDYKLLCPRYDCLKKGKTICEECFVNKSNVVKHRCMKNSLLASIIAYGESKKWNRNVVEQYCDYFICPSQFMANAMKRGGFDANKIKVISNFIDTSKCHLDTYEKEDYYCYVGRISHEKGLETLINVANNLNYKLIIIGTGPSESKLKRIAEKNVIFVGYKQWDEIKDIVRKAKFTVVPSEWYEVFGLVNAESLCLGTPILGARIGGIPELIEEGVSGMTFESGNVVDLKKKIEMMWISSFDYKSIAENAVKRYSSEVYYEKLMECYHV